MTTNPLIDRAAFLAFVLEQPQDERYQSGNASACAMAQFLRTRCGVPGAYVYYGYAYLDGNMSTQTELDHDVEQAVYASRMLVDEFGGQKVYSFPDREFNDEMDDSNVYTWGALATRLQAL